MAVEKRTKVNGFTFTRNGEVVRPTAPKPARPPVKGFTRRASIELEPTETTEPDGSEDDGRA